jgi:hypothetical protein
MLSLASGTVCVDAPILISLDKPLETQGWATLVFSDFPESHFTTGARRLDGSFCFDDIGAAQETFALAGLKDDNVWVHVAGGS